jgi:hypothetical protein
MDRWKVNGFCYISCVNESTEIMYPSKDLFTSPQHRNTSEEKLNLLLAGTLQIGQKRQD